MLKDEMSRDKIEPAAPRYAHVRKPSAVELSSTGSWVPQKEQAEQGRPGCIPKRLR